MKIASVRSGRRTAASLLSILIVFLSSSFIASQDLILGSTGTNVCPAGRAKVTTAAACKKAGKAVEADEQDWNGSENESAWPSGCYYCDGVDDCGDGFWFNKDLGGSVNGDAQPVCALPTWSGCENGAACGEIGSNSVTTLLAGDSDVEGWPSNKWKRAFGSDGVNEGVGGWTCEKLNKRIDGFLTTYDPYWVVLVCGENDLDDHGDVSKTFANFKQVVDKILANGARILYVGTKPEPSTKSLHDEYRKYDKLIKALARDLAADTTATEPPLVMVDSYASFEEIGNKKKYYDEDKLHLSKKGYDKWTNWAKWAVEKADQSSSCTVWQKKRCTQGGSSIRVE